MNRRLFVFLNNPENLIIYGLATTQLQKWMTYLSNMGISKEAVRHFKSAMEAIDEEMKELGPLLDEAYAKRNSNIKQKSEDSDQKQPPDNGKLSDEDIANAIDTLVKNVPEITWSGGKK